MASAGEMLLGKAQKRRPDAAAMCIGGDGDRGDVRRCGESMWSDEDEADRLSAAVAGDEELRARPCERLAATLEIPA